MVVVAVVVVAVVVVAVVVVAVAVAVMVVVAVACIAGVLVHPEAVVVVSRGAHWMQSAPDLQRLTAMRFQAR
jgi:hypothetical protein